MKLLFLFLLPSVSYGAIHFDDLAGQFFSTSQQTQVVQQDRNRTELEYDLALGSFYDPLLKAGWFSQFEGSYKNRHSDLSILQRTPFWGAQIQLGYRFGRGSYPLYEGQWLTQNRGEVRLGLEIPILRNGSTDLFRTAIDKGEVSLSLSRYQEWSQNLQLLQQLGTRYWDWYAQGQRLKVFRHLLELAEKRQSQIVKRVSHGDLAKIEQLEGERTILQRKSLLAQQERFFVKSRLDLKTLVLDRSNIEQHQFELIDLPDLEIKRSSYNLDHDPQDEKSIAMNHPEVQRQNLILEQSRMDLTLAKNQFFPKLDLQFYGSRDLGEEVTSLSGFQGEAGVFFEFPIPSRAASARIDQASAMVIRQESQYEISKIRIINAVKESKNAVSVAAQRLNYSFDELDLAIRLAQLEGKRFLGGDSNLLLLNIREQNLAEAEIRKYESFTDLQKAFNDYSVAVGTLKWKKEHE